MILNDIVEEAPRAVLEIVRVKMLGFAPADKRDLASFRHLLLPVSEE